MLEELARKFEEVTSQPMKHKTFRVCHAVAKLVRYEDGCLTICKVRTNNMEVCPLYTRDMALRNPQAADKIKAK
jgi:hypothetical protein